MSKRKVAIIGSGNIGTDLMIKILRHGQHLEMAVMVGIDPQSDGLARARRMGVATTHEGVIGLMNMPEFADIDIVFDATSAGAHVKNDAALREAKPDIRLIDLTPAAIGPYCVPVVNLEENVDQLNVNMVTCGGQATIPIVAAVSRVARVHYAEIIASIASKSAGPGTRANIDEFTETTSRAIEVVGGAARVNMEKCMGCLKCVSTCPRGLITVVPYGSDVYITCASKDKGVETRKACDSGCIGCSLCAKACPVQAITVENNLASIDYSKCIACGACVEKCPRKLIRMAVHRHDESHVPEAAG